jgi:hypothetical protein
MRARLFALDTPKSTQMDAPKNTSRFQKGNPGKPKGALSKTTKTAKEAIALAADGLGGVDRLVAWAKEDPLNERSFWSSIYPRLLPVQVSGDADNPLQHAVKITFG